MDTIVVDGIKGASHIEKSKAMPFRCHYFAGPWRYLLRLCDFD